MDGKKLCFVTLAAFSAGFPGSAWLQVNLDEVDRATVQTIAAHLALDGVTGIDFAAKSGEYCLNAGLPKGGHMTHYSVDPTATREDIVDFVDARPLVEAVSPSRLCRATTALSAA